MSAYQLTRKETLTLCELLHLPVQRGSVLSNFLGEKKLAEAPSQQDLDTLAGKGYYLPRTPAAPFPVELVTSLTLAAFNAAELTVTLGTGEQAALTRFGQVGEGLVEYGIDGENLYLHPATRAREVAARFLPEKIEVQKDEQVKEELPLGAFLLFRRACLASDIAFVESKFKSKRFSRDALEELFREGEDWVDIFNAEGLAGVMSMEQMPVEAYLNHLIAMGNLQGDGNGMYEICEAGQALKEALTDPDLRQRTFSLNIQEGGYPTTGSYIYGGGRLFLLQIQPGMIGVRQLAGREAAQIWIEELLEKGSHARHKALVIPPVAKKETAQPAKVVMPAKKRKISIPLVVASVAALLVACCLLVVGGVTLLYAFGFFLK